MIEVMLCKPVKSLTELDLNEYVAEPKLDGDRLVLERFNGVVRLYNRRGKDVTFRYPELAENFVAYTDDDIILDGEVIVRINGKDNFNEGIAHRTHLTNPFKIDLAMKIYPVEFIAFDVLRVGSMDTTELPLYERRNILKSVLFQENKNFKLIEQVTENEQIKELWERIKTEQREGIILKKIRSKYWYGKRNNDWLKLKNFKEVILKFTKYSVNPAGIRLEDEKGNVVQCAGKQSEQVKELIDRNGECWAEVQYLELTKEKRMRMPSFKRIVNNIKIYK